MGDQTANNPRSLLSASSSGEQAADESGLVDFCIPNIGPAQRRRRLFSGIVMGAVGIGLLAAFSALNVGYLWGLVLFLPFWGGATGVFQALEKT